MSSSTERSSIQRIVWYWPWTVLALAIVPAIWHVLDFPSDINPEDPEVVRPTFSRQPPPAYHPAESGDTIDNIAVYLSAGAILIAARGLLRCRGAGRGIGLWPAALGLALGAFWYASNPGPTLNGWHGLGWRAIADPRAPGALRLTLVGTAVGLVVLIARSILVARGHPVGFWYRGCDRGNLGLLAAALILVGLRQGEIPGIEPVGNWPLWAFDWGLLASDLALIRAMAPDLNQALGSHLSGFDGRGLMRLGMYGIA
jgi:hypothetical protein